MNTLLGPFRDWKRLCQWWSLKLKLHGESASAHDASSVQAPSGVQVLPLGRPCPFLFPFTSSDCTPTPGFSLCLFAALCIAYVVLITWNVVHPLLHLGRSTPPTGPGQVSFPLWDWSFLTPLGIVMLQLVPGRPHNTLFCVCLSYQHLKPLRACNLFFYPVPKSVSGTW